MKKYIAFALALCLTLFAGCGSSNNSKTTYKDGTYAAEGAGYDEKGFKPTVSITVANGKIAEVTINDINELGELKTDIEAAGGYPMKEQANSKGTWAEEIAALEKAIVEKQDPAAIKLNSEGKTDSVAGCTIHVSDYIQLSTEALEKAR